MRDGTERLAVAKASIELNGCHSLPSSSRSFG